MFHSTAPRFNLVAYWETVYPHHTPALAREKRRTAKRGNVISLPDRPKRKRRSFTGCAVMVETVKPVSIGHQKTAGRVVVGPRFPKYSARGQSVSLNFENRADADTLEFATPKRELAARLTRDAVHQMHAPGEVVKVGNSHPEHLRPLALFPSHPIRSVKRLTDNTLSVAGQHLRQECPTGAGS